MGSATFAWWAAWSPDGLPSWDSSGYLLQALRLRETILAGDPAAFVWELTRPDLHPPLHGLFVALWMLVAGTSLAASRVYAGLAFVAGLGWIAALGARADRARGWTVGALAALLCALGIGSLQLVSTPMTEATALPMLYWALWVAAGRVGAPGVRVSARARLEVGLAVMLTGLVRYNLPPMLFAPLFLHHAWEQRGAWRDPARRRLLLDPRVLLWVAPTVVIFAAWQLLRPDMAEQIQKFLENRSSGIPFWTAENLLWVPIKVTSDYFSTPIVSVPLFVGFLLGFLPPRWRPWGGAGGDEPDRLGQGPGEGVLGLLQWFALVAFFLLTLHDFKISRNLGPVLPSFSIVAVSTLLAIRWPGVSTLAERRPALGVVALLLLAPPYAIWQHVAKLGDVANTGDFRPDPTVRAALEFIDRHARERERTWVVGWVYRISPNLIEYWLRTHEVPTKLLLEQPHFGEETRTGVSWAWDDRYAARVQDVMLAPAEVERTTYVTISITPGTRYWDEWKAYGNNYARAFAEQQAIPEVDRYQNADRGLLVRVYRSGGTPSEASRAAVSTGPVSADDVGILLPADPPLYRDTMNGAAPGWLVTPPDAIDKVEVTRSGGRLSLHIPAPLEALQLCDQVRPNPTGGANPVRVVMNVRTEGLRGPAWLHVRGMGVDGTLQKSAGDAPDITMAGPLPATDTRVYELDVQPTPTSAQLKACVVLDHVEGTVTLEDYAIFAPNVPRVGPPPPLSGEAGQAGEAGAPGTSGPFTPTGWRLVPADAADVVLRPRAEGLTVQIPSGRTPLQVCAEPVPYVGEAEAALAVRAEGVTGKAWFHYRALDAGGVLLKDAAGGGRIVQAGPFTGGGRTEATSRLAFPAETRTVRPCLVLDAVSGTVTVETLRWTTR